MDPNNVPSPQNEPAVATGGQTPPQDPGYKYDDLQKQSVREIAEGQTPPAPPTPPSEPETPKEPETPATPPAPQLSAEEIAKQTADEIEAREKAAAEEQARKEAEAEPTDKEKEYLEWEDEFKKKENRPPTYSEALKFVSDQAIKEIEARQAEKDRIAAEEQEAAKKTQEEADKQLNAIVDDELSELYQAGKLTKIVDPNNPSDQGVIERQALFTKWQEINMERRSKNLPPIVSPIRIYDFYYTKPNAQPAGANAPVAGNRGSATPPSNEQSYSYQDIKKPWGFFKSRP